MEFLRVSQSKICDGGQPVRLQGVNLGGWLMPEGYILHAPNRAHCTFKRDFIRELGPQTYAEMEQSFRDNFIKEEDIIRMKAFNFNCLRVPFHYGLLEDKPYSYCKDGAKYLDRIIKWAGRYDVRVILDMHAAPGAQNHDWHSDAEAGKKLFWAKKTNQRRAIGIWQFLADRYKDNPVVAGFDLLNEPVLDEVESLNSFYSEAIKAIRQIDRNHIIFVEGNRWAQDIDCLEDFDDDNLVLSIHYYEPTEFVFNFVPHLKYPADSKEVPLTKEHLGKRLETFRALADRRKRALWCGEFGVNSRDGLAGEDRWLADVLSVFRDLDIHWTYWTWKAVKHYIFPDGIFSYYPNVPWVNRSGPEFGWETWTKHWPTRKREMIASWRLDKYTLNRKIAEVIDEAV